MSTGVSGSLQQGDTTAVMSDSAFPVPSVLGKVLDEEQALEAARALSLVAEPERLRLLSLIADRGGCVCEFDLIAPLGRSQPTVSHHLKVLCHGGLLEREKRGRWVWYRLLPERLVDLCGILGERERAASVRDDASAETSVSSSLH